MLTHTERTQVVRAEAVSLRERPRNDCTVCAEQGYPNRHECDLNCHQSEKWAEED